MARRELGPYTIEDRLATGGMAEVFVARRSGPHGFTKRVALKRILPQYARDPDFVGMFVDEARLAARLEHPNIVQVFDFGEFHGELFLAMELVTGTNVNRLLRSASTRAQEIPLDVALHIAGQTSHALSYAHRALDERGQELGIVHRDVSPANILLTQTGHVKLSDFGIARMAGSSPHTDDGQIRGKLGYMSPEQVTGKPLDGKSDVFTLATVLAEMLIGAPLFGTGSDLDVLLRIRDGELRALDDTKRRIPRDVERLVRSGLSTDLEARPSSTQFATAIDEILRRRGATAGADRLARALQRLGQGEPQDPNAREHGARPTNFFDTTGLTATDEVDAGLDASCPAIYSVKLSDGVVGPVAYPRLVQMITGGQVVPTTPISKAGGMFEPAEQLAELSRFITSPGLLWRLDEISRASRTGALQSGALLPVVHRIHADNDTGVLYLREPQRMKKIYFIDGRPDFIASTDRRELLGEFLVRSGACLRMEVDMALAMLPRYNGRLGDALVGLGILRPGELFRAITQQVKARYLEAFHWRTGEWAFVPDERANEETYPLGHDRCELLRDAALEAHPEEMEAVLSPLRERVLVKHPDPPFPLRSFAVPEPWRELLDVAGDATFASILGRRSEDTETVYRAFYLGLSCDLVKAAA